MADCKTCKTKIKEPDSVPYIVYESAMARADRKEKRMIGVIVLLIVLFTGTVFGWMYERSQWETVEETSYEVNQEAENGTNNFAGGDMNGTPENQSNKND